MSVKQCSTTIAGSSTLSADGTAVTFTPASSLPADADITTTLNGVTSVDGASLATPTWTFHTRSADSVTNQTLFGDVVPSVLAATEGSPVEVGTAFTPSKNGRITALRFYKGAG